MLIPACVFFSSIAEKVSSLGKDWHKFCLKCERCNKTLNPGGHAEVGQPGEKSVYIAPEGISRAQCNAGVWSVFISLSVLYPSVYDFAYSSEYRTEAYRLVYNVFCQLGRYSLHIIVLRCYGLVGVRK